MLQLTPVKDNNMSREEWIKIYTCIVGGGGGSDEGEIANYFQPFQPQKLYINNLIETIV